MATTRPRHTFCSSKYRFHVLEVSIELIHLLRPLRCKLARHSKSLATQLERAASSIAANVSEGRRRAGKDRLYHFRVAAGSADETRTHLLVAHAWGYLESAEINESIALIDRILAMLYRLSRG